MSAVRTTSVERDEARLSSRGGFAFLLTFGITWSLAGASTFVFPVEIAALVFLFQGVLGTPASFVLERLLGYPPMSRDNSLTPLFIQVAVSQLPPFLAAWIVYVLDPLYVPAALAAIVGGHFLPYVWIHKTNLYAVMAVIVAVVPFFMAATLGETAFRYVGFVVGLTLVVFAFVIRAQVERELTG